MSVPLWLMIAGLASSVIFGGLQIWQNSATNGRNVDLQRENNDLQRQLAGQANEWNLQQWQRENAYNNPSAQLARLAGANLNPALIYGQGGLVNEAAASPAAMMANTRSAQVQSPLANMSSSIDPVSLSQIALNNAQADNLNAKTKTENEQRDAAIQFLQAQTDNLHTQNEEIVARINRLSKENELTDAQINQIDEQLSIAWRSLWNDDKRLSNETSMTETQVDLLKNQIRKTLAEAKVTEKEFQLLCDTYAQRVLGFKLDNGVKAADYKIALATADKLKLEKMILEPDATYAEAANRRGKMFGKGDDSSISYVVGDFMQYIVEYVARELGHVIH